MLKYVKVANIARKMFKILSSLPLYMQQTYMFKNIYEPSSK